MARNTNVLDGFACPKCQRNGPFKISVTVYGLVTVDDDGFDLNELAVSESDWADDSSCECAHCGFFGYVSEFKENG